MSSAFTFTLVLLIVITSVNVRVLAQSFVAEVCENNDIVPDVIPEAPEYGVLVYYPRGVWVNLGNELTPTQAKDMPNVKYNAAFECFYTLALVDPDAPSRAYPVFREWNHWLVVNIPGNNVALGETIAEYIGSAPPVGTGLHRYVFLIYQQPGLLEFDEPRLNNTSANNRAKFSIANFAEKYNLGDPVAGNFFQAQYDEYVPILNSQMGL